MNPKNKYDLVSTQPNSTQGSPNHSNERNNVEIANKSESNNKEINRNKKTRKNLLEEKYDILRKLGEGSHGKVYLGRKKNSKSHVAIKIIKIESLSSESKFSNLQNEIEIVKSLKRNPYTLELKDLMKDEEYLYLVFSYVGSRNLSEFLSENQQLSVRLF